MYTTGCRWCYVQIKSIPGLRTTALAAIYCKLCRRCWIVCKYETQKNATKKGRQNASPNVKALAFSTSLIVGDLLRKGVSKASSFVSPLSWGNYFTRGTINSICIISHLFCLVNLDNLSASSNASTSSRAACSSLISMLLVILLVAINHTPLPCR